MTTLAENTEKKVLSLRVQTVWAALPTGLELDRRLRKLALHCFTFTGLLQVSLRVYHG